MAAWSWRKQAVQLGCWHSRKCQMALDSHLQCGQEVAVFCGCCMTSSLEGEPVMKELLDVCLVDQKELADGQAVVVRLYFVCRYAH